MAAARISAPVDDEGVRSGQPLDFTLRQIERALRQRTRYRYVKPSVSRGPSGDGYVIESPCCSRNVDPEGGTIAIAWLVREPCGEAPMSSSLWRLHARNHEAACWVPRHESANVAELLDLLCIDAERVFWP